MLYEVWPYTFGYIHGIMVQENYNQCLISVYLIQFCDKLDL